LVSVKMVRNDSPVKQADLWQNKVPFPNVCSSNTNSNDQALAFSQRIMIIRKVFFCNYLRKIMFSCFKFQLILNACLIQLFETRF